MILLMENCNFSESIRIYNCISVDKYYHQKKNITNISYDSSDNSDENKNLDISYDTDLTDLSELSDLSESLNESNSSDKLNQLDVSCDYSKNKINNDIYISTNTSINGYIDGSINIMMDNEEEKHNENIKKYYGEIPSSGKLLILTIPRILLTLLISLIVIIISIIIKIYENNNLFIQTYYYMIISYHIFMFIFYPFLSYYFKYMTIYKYKTKKINRIFKKILLTLFLLLTIFFIVIFFILFIYISFVSNLLTNENLKGYYYIISVISLFYVFFIFGHTLYQITFE